MDEAPSLYKPSEHSYISKRDDVSMLSKKSYMLQDTSKMDLVKLKLLAKKLEEKKKKNKRKLDEILTETTR